jgi:DNA-binding XRE family transcriptional regulator
MTTTPEKPSPAFQLVDEALKVQAAPDRDQRKNIRVRARITISRLAREVGVTPQRIRQYERMEFLPATANSLRYIAVLEHLDARMQEMAGSQPAA